MSATEQEYKNHIKELEQQVRLLKEQVDFLTRKLNGTKSEKTSALEIEGQMSLFVRAKPCLPLWSFSLIRKTELWKTNKPPAMQVSQHCFSLQKKPPVV